MDNEKAIMALTAAMVVAMMMLPLVPGAIAGFFTGGWGAVPEAAAGGGLGAGAGAAVTAGISIAVGIVAPPVGMGIAAFIGLSALAGGAGGAVAGA
ncbi:MAG: hypothetical protein SVE93_01085 [Candidatus Thermoplasmatota archaeon]|nr:hypothetical protein [Candidatus Thermoplasmatota archaeon]